MKTQEYKRPPFFGRQQEIKELRRRIQKPGLTVVKGRPRIGKSRLLEEFVSQLRDEADQQPAAERLLVGWLREPGTEGNSLLRAVADAYDHMLADASWREQLGLVWEQNKDRIVGRAGMAIGEIIGEGVVGAGPLVPGASFAGAAIKRVFGTLRSIDEKLHTGRSQIDPLQADEAKSLLWFLAKDRKSPVVLALNQWEDGLFLDHDFITLKTFLQNIHDWPSVHVLLHLRCPLRPDNVDQDAVKKAEGLVCAYPSADPIEVPPIDFVEDETTRREVLDWLKKHFPGMREMAEEDLLSKVIAGNPAVLDEWVNLNKAGREDPATLIEKAINAQKYLYPEMESFLLDLVQKAEQYDKHSTEILAAAVRLAVIPPPGSAEAWSAVKEAILGDLDEAVLTSFESLDYLRHSGDGIPSFGHSTRHETARHLALENQRLTPYARHALEKLAEALADESDLPSADQGIARDSYIRHSLLLKMVFPLVALQSRPISQQLAVAAGTLFNLPWPDTVPIGRVSSSELTALTSTRARLLAMGLVNSIGDAGSDGERADRLLTALRALHGGHSSDGTVREALARGLYNAIHHARSDSERADALLGELRALNEAYSEDATIRQRLATGLFNRFNHCRSDAEQAAGYLGELRALCEACPGDEVVREELAKGLVNAIRDAGSDMERALEFLAELRALCEACPGDEVVCEELAKGLVNAIGHAGSDMKPVDAFLVELRALYKANVDEVASAQELAAGLVNAIAHAGCDTDRAAELLGELRALYGAHFDDVAIRESFAKGLANTLLNHDSSRDWAAELLGELRALHEAHAEEIAVREQLAGGLASAVDLAGFNMKRAIALLNELRALYEACPENTAIREALARGLVSAICNYGSNARRVDSLLQKLRSLREAHSRDATVREGLARGLVNAIGHAGSDTERANALLQELRSLCEAHSEEAILREGLTRGLMSAIGHAGFDTERAHTLLVELLGLCQAHPDVHSVVGALFGKLRNMKPQDLDD